ncbi:MAG: SDR family oxidoreductase, partial [Candidatus Marinimicrobia bacterium]|nr:SDR family oxidoreductase [Candidatus Neomarinimicrobiota bacterium]
MTANGVDAVNKPPPTPAQPATVAPLADWPRLFDLAGRTALVTGSSRGIGKAIAQILGQAGAQVFVHGSRPSEALDATLAEFRAHGLEAASCCADIADSAANRKLAAEVGPVDILVLNASIQYKTQWTEIDTGQFAAQINTNLRSTIELIQGFAPAMLARGWGRIVVVGSVNQDRQHPELAVYSATKSAGLNLCQNFARQFAPAGVTVNNLAPGVIDTDRNAEALANEAYRQQVLARIPSGVIGVPEDCAGLALVLCSAA